MYLCSLLSLELHWRVLEFIHLICKSLLTISLPWYCFSTPGPYPVLSLCLPCTWFLNPCSFSSSSFYLAALLLARAISLLHLLQVRISDSLSPYTTNLSPTVHPLLQNFPLSIKHTFSSFSPISVLDSRPSILFSQLWSWCPTTSSLGQCYLHSFPVSSPSLGLQTPFLTSLPCPYGT